MPLFNNGSAQLRPNSRSHTNLVKSEGSAPAVQYQVDPNLPGLFTYDYAVNRHLSKVVIPKGTIVSVGPAVRDYATLKYRNTVGFADGTVNAGKLPVGIAPYNYFRRYDVDELGVETIAHDKFGGDDFQPGIITREFIEVPYMPNPQDVYTYSGQNVNGMKMNWGCATNVTVDVVGTSDALQAGDYVKPGAFGKFVKFNAGDDPRLIVGQVLEMDTDLPPLGWLKYVEPVFEGPDSPRETAQAADLAAAPADGSMVYDPDYKWPLTLDYKSPGAWKQIGGGFPGLTDGAKAGLTTRIQKFTTAGTTTAKVCILDPAAKIDGTTLVVKLDGATLSAGDGDFTYNDETQIVTIAAALDTAALAVEVSYKVDLASLIGTPASWDYAGSVGVVRILLKL